MKVTDKFVLFWGGELSNFAKCDPPIEFRNPTISPDFYNPNKGFLESMKFPTSEHLFMYLKAVYFKDYEVADKILQAKEPSEAKGLGRTVKGFSEEAWEKVRYQAMYTAVYHKTYFNSTFKSLILKPEWENLEFVEASPYDRIWGVGLAEGDPDINVKKKWRGLNLLGRAQCEVRAYLKWSSWVSTWGLNEFQEDLIWCPSQIYYWFMVGDQMKIVYMRWRWNDPWTIEICPVLDPSNPSSWTFEGGEYVNLGKDYKDVEYRQMELDLIDYLKKTYPESNIPDKPIVKNPRDWTGTKTI